MKLATDSDLFPDRKCFHKYMAEPGSCDNCGGIGWTADEYGELYCNCAAGTARKVVDSDDENEV